MAMIPAQAINQWCKTRLITDHCDITGEVRRGVHSVVKIRSVAPTRCLSV